MTTTENPWIEEHIQAETDYQGGNRRLAAKLVRNEYRGAPESLPCPCGNTLHFRMTIGAYKCPDCGQLARGNGQLIEVAR